MWGIAGGRAQCLMEMKAWSLLSLPGNTISSRPLWCLQLAYQQSKTLIYWIKCTIWQRKQQIWDAKTRDCFALSLEKCSCSMRIHGKVAGWRQCYTDTSARQTLTAPAHLSIHTPLQTLSGWKGTSRQDGRQSHGKPRRASKSTLAFIALLHLSLILPLCLYLTLSTCPCLSHSLCSLFSRHPHHWSG